MNPKETFIDPMDELMARFSDDNTSKEDTSEVTPVTPEIDRPVDVIDDDDAGRIRQGHQQIFLQFGLSRPRFAGDDDRFAMLQGLKEDLLGVARKEFFIPRHGRAHATQTQGERIGLAVIDARQGQKGRVKSITAKGNVQDGVHIRKLLFA